MEKALSAFLRYSTIIFAEMSATVIPPITVAAIVLYLSCASSTMPEQEVPPQMTFEPAMSASVKDVHNFLNEGNGSAEAKLVFVKKSHPSGASPQTYSLHYIDFSEPADTPVIHRIAAAIEPRVPVVSPDGRWVVYACGNGAETGSSVAYRSDIYLCKLQEDAEPVLLVHDSACEPRFFQTSMNPSTLSIVYTTLAPNLAWNGIGKTMRIDVDIGKSPPAIIRKSVVWDKGSYAGGVSYDERYLCAGGGRTAMLDLVTLSQIDSVDVFRQACNASISSSRLFTNTVMYLTGGDQHPDVNNNKPFKTWEIIFISNFYRKIAAWYKCPDTAAFKFTLETKIPSYYSHRWHHPEWSNHPYFAAAAIAVSRYFTEDTNSYVNTAYQERIILIKLMKPTAFLELLRIKDIAYSHHNNDDSGYYWPWLWVGIPPGFIEDPLWLESR